MAGRTVRAVSPRFSPPSAPTKNYGTTKPTITGGDWSVPGISAEDNWYDTQMNNIMLDRDDVQSQIASWGDILDMTSGDINWVNRWLIQNSIVSGLYDELHDLNMEAAQINAQRD